MIEHDVHGKIAHVISGIPRHSRAPCQIQLEIRVKLRRSGANNRLRLFVLGISQAVRLNFRMQVGNVAQSVEVAVAADTLIATTSASVGAVLPEYKLNDLPLLSRDADIRGAGVVRVIW